MSAEPIAPLSLDGWSQDAPGWWRNAVIYQVYVRSFQDSDGDGVGDLEGVRSRLPYLRSLGVDGIWLNPFYASPQYDHGYDVSDYRAVHPEYGDLAGFDRLVHDAHRLDIKVVIDVVPNHCSIEHAWFTAAVSAGPGSAERRRFHFADGRGQYGELPPNNWRSIFGGPAWHRISEPDGSPGQWYLHTFAPEQADFDWTNREVAEHFDEYTERTGRERVLIGEVGVIDTAELAAYQRPDELHQCFFFEFLRAPWDAPSLARVIDRGLDTVAAWNSPVAWVLNSHDMPRSVTRYAGGAPGVSPGDIDLGSTRARAAALLMLALPGSAYLYQGEELGLPEVTDLPDHLLTDPMFRRSDGARRGRDGCRVPLPWVEGQESMGFSPVGTRASTWLPQPDWFAHHSVDRQLESGESMLLLYREAIALRRRIPALSTNRFHWLLTEPGVLAFTRGDGVACVVNLSARPVCAPVGSQLLLGSNPEVGEKLPPDTAGWFLLEVTR